MILDMTCGEKQMWFQKNIEDVVYLDIRNQEIEYYSGEIDYHSEIKPDIQADNRYLPFKNNVFDLVLFDPPHIIGENTGLFYSKYGWLEPITWTMDLSKAIREGFRVLKIGGFFIFKWSESRSKKAIREALYLFPCKPLFGTKTTPNLGTWWIVFRKDK